MPPRAPVETKVLAATAGFIGSSTVAAFAVWLLGAIVWHAGTAASDVDAALAAVPSPVAALVLLLLGSAGTFVSGYLAPHTTRTVDP